MHKSWHGEGAAPDSSVQLSYSPTSHCWHRFHTAATPCVRPGCSPVTHALLSAQKTGRRTCPSYAPPDMLPMVWNTLFTWKHICIRKTHLQKEAKFRSCQMLWTSLLSSEFPLLKEMKVQGTLKLHTHIAIAECHPTVQQANVKRRMINDIIKPELQSAKCRRQAFANNKAKEDWF